MCRCSRVLLCVPRAVAADHIQSFPPLPSACHYCAADDVRPSSEGDVEIPLEGGMGVDRVKVAVAPGSTRVVVPRRFQRLCKELTAAAVANSILIPSARRASAADVMTGLATATALGARGEGASAAMASALAGIPPQLALSIAKHMMAMVAVVMSHRQAAGVRYGATGMHGSPPASQVVWHIDWGLQARFAQQVAVARQVLALVTLMKITATPWWRERIGRRIRQARDLLSKASDSIRPGMVGGEVCNRPSRRFSASGVLVFFPVSHSSESHVASRPDHKHRENLGQ